MLGERTATVRIEHHLCAYGHASAASPVLHRTPTILTRSTEVLEWRQSWEAAMGSFKRPRVFDPLDLEIVDRVYEAAWAQVEARETNRDREQDGERQEALRKRIFACAYPGRVDFDILYESVIASLAQSELEVSNRGSNAAPPSPPTADK